MWKNPVPFDRRLVWLALMTISGCLTRNPAVCCETEGECETLGFSDPAPCKVGLCVANACVDEGCDGPEDCTDPGRPICEASHCIVTPPPATPPGCSITGGERIVFVSDRDGDQEILAMPADGGAATNLTDNVVPDFGPQASSDGSAIAFLREEGKLDVIIADAFGADARNVSDDFNAESSVRWSPDMTRLAISAIDINGNGVVLAMNSDGTERVGPVTLATSDNYDVGWSPDSARLSFGTARFQPSPLFGVCTVARDGTDLMCPFSKACKTPVWSPAGIDIAASSLGGGDPGTAPMQIWTTRTDSGSDRQLTSFASGDSTEPAWSNDGQQLAFVHEGDIWTMGRDGYNERNLTMDGLSNAHPRWSADNNSLLYESVRGSKREVFRIGADGSNPTNLTNDGADDHSAEWARCP
ncbi:MAG: hypothetical protein WKG01_25550 [Kofleriaceae bacterium]